jgi:hypothetical protein
MLILMLACLLLLFPVIVFVPGFLVVRRWGLPDELRLSLSIAVSLLLVSTTAFLLYLLGAGRIAYVGVSAIVIAATVISRRSLDAFRRAPAVRLWGLHYAVFLACLLILCLVSRNFSGDGWAGDWEEHYQRALLFCGRVPLDAPLTGGWSVTARPPFQNLVAAFFLQNLGAGFTLYQLAATLLSSLVFFGAASLWYAVTRGLDATMRGGLLPLTALLCLNPSVVQNATYPWTRSLANFFVLQGLALFWLAVRDRAPGLRRWSYLLLGLAALTHYSAAPYVIALLLVEIGLLATRRLSFRAAAADVSLFVIPLLPWLVFAVYHFGLAGALLSNSTVMDTASLGWAGNGGKVLGNVVSTLVPYPLRGVPPLYDQADRLDYVRDAAFLIYQVNLPFMVGSVGSLVLLWLWAKNSMLALRARRLGLSIAVSAFVLTVGLLGIASVGEPDQFGVAHVCLQPLAIAGLVYLAAHWSQLSLVPRVALGVGALVDGVFGIALHFWMRHLDLDDIVGLHAVLRAVSPNFVSNLQRQVDLQYVLVGDLPWHNAGIALLLLVLIVLVRRARASIPS